MSIEIKAPTFPEDVGNATLAIVHAEPGKKVKRDDLIFEIETDKVVLEVVAPSDGFITNYVLDVGETVASNQVVGVFSPLQIPDKQPESEFLGEIKDEAAPLVEPRVVAQVVEKGTSKPNSYLFGGAIFIAGLFVGVLLMKYFGA